jgi:hypothetical protein
MPQMTKYSVVPLRLHFGTYRTQPCNRTSSLSSPQITHVFISEKPAGSTPRNMSSGLCPSLHVVWACVWSGEHGETARDRWVAMVRVLAS